MKRRVAVIVICCAYATGVEAEQQLTRWTVDGGGGSSSSARYRLTGTIGQPDAIPLLYGGAWRLGGGFWADVQPMIFRDGFEE